jgi:Raf kinase inhibitor-like YbhB/YbcL family protein
MAANDPFYRLPQVPSFTLTSSDVSDGQQLSPPQMSGIFGVPGGTDTSPQLSWSGAPAGTKSYTVTMYDPDAPRGSGLWHWAVADIPSSVTELPEGAGSRASDRLPDGAFQLQNDARMACFLGGAPPPGDSPHRYSIVVDALNIDHVAELGVKPESTPAMMGFYVNAGGHLLGRAVITPVGQVPAA